MGDSMRERFDKVFDDFKSQLMEVVESDKDGDTEKQGKGLALVTEAVQRLQSVMAGLKAGKPSGEFSKTVDAVRAMLNSYMSEYPSEQSKDEEADKDEKDKKDREDEQKASKPKDDDDAADKDKDDDADKKDKTKKSAGDMTFEEADSDPSVWNDVDSRVNAWTRKYDEPAV